MQWIFLLHLSDKKKIYKKKIDYMSLMIVVAKIFR